MSTRFANTYLGETSCHPIRVGAEHLGWLELMPGAGRRSSSMLYVSEPKVHSLGITCSHSKHGPGGRYITIVMRRPRAPAKRTNCFGTEIHAVFFFLVDEVISVPRWRLDRLFILKERE